MHKFSFSPESSIFPCTYSSIFPCQMQVFFQCINSAISYFPLQRIIYFPMHSPEEIHLFSPCIPTHRFSFFPCTNSSFPLNRLFPHAHIHLFPHAQIQVFFKCINSAIFPIQRYGFFFSIFIYSGNQISDHDHFPMHKYSFYQLPLILTALLRVAW